MIWIHLIVIFALFGFYSAYDKIRHSSSRKMEKAVPFFTAAVLLRIIIVLLYEDNWIVGIIWRVPAIAGDMMAAKILYHEAQIRKSRTAGFWIACIYLFNPAVVGQCSVWGKIDDPFTWSIVLVCAVYYAIKLFKRKWPAGTGRFSGKINTYNICITAAFCLIIFGILNTGNALGFFYPALLFLLLSYLYSGYSKIFDCYVAFSICFYYKMAYFFLVRPSLTEGYQHAWIVTISICTVLAFLYFCKALFDQRAVWRKGKLPEASAKIMKFTRKDCLCIIVLCTIYGGIAFWNLGDLHSPQTEYQIEPGDCVVLDFKEDKEISVMNWYVLDYRMISLSIDIRNEDGEEWEFIQDITMEAPFRWGSADLESSGRYIRLTNNTSDPIAIGELVFQDKEGAVQKPQNVIFMKALFDEQEVFPEEIDYQTGTYFDETFYVQSVFDMMTGTKTFECTHPPLGKILIACGTLLFGITPFGFRFVGTILGIGMLPLLYLLGRDITKSRFLGSFAAFLFAVDFMHFTQTRIATIDVYITFFTILMFFFMYRYSRLSFYDSSLKKTFKPLGACGIAFGLGISCKWTGFYAGAGLAVVFFSILYKRYREYVYASRRPEEFSNGISHKFIIKNFKKYTVETIVFCIIFFIVIPFFIYLASYIPFSDGTDANLLERMWNNQKYMFWFHTTLDADHIFASSWYQWPLMIRPVYYFARSISDTVGQGISAFGNPVVWWGGIPAFLFMIYLGIKKADKNAVFLCIAYGACYFPWCFVTRCTFMYHYFPCVPFLCCMIMYMFSQWKSKLKKKYWLAMVIGCSGAALVLFIMFYPVISGAPVSKAYVTEVLRWMDTWQLIS